MRIVCISDTHNYHNEISIPDGDLLIHAGDATIQGTITDYIDNLATLQTDYRELKKNDSTPLGIGVLGRNESNTANIILANLNLAEDKWTDAGLNLTAEDLANIGFGIGSPAFNYTFRVRGDSINHITAIYDPLAEAVEFNPTNSDVYFLLPSIYFTYGSNSAPSGSITYVQYLNWFFWQRPRNIFVDPENEFYSYQINQNWFNGESLSDYEAAYEGGVVMRSLEGARMFETHGSGTNWLWEHDTPAENFNNAAYSSLYEVYPDGDFLLTNFVQSPLPEDFRILLAIIRQGENYFYVWSNID